MKANNFYVYVYIDPRNFQEFYYGKGQDDRKTSHLKDSSDSEKSRIIKEIKQEGLEPIIKVIAKDLTEDQAFLIEKTLIWKLGKTLTNKSSGHFAKNFRPQNSLHKDLQGYDYVNGIYAINVGEGPHRHWDDSHKYGFISAGQNWKKYGSRICSLRPGDIICAYLSDYGYVGVGKVLNQAVLPGQFFHEGKPLSSLQLTQPNILKVHTDPKNGEHVMKVQWIRSYDRTKAVGGTRDVWRPSSMLASIAGQKKTLEFLEKQFDLSFQNLLLTSQRQ